jgi:radical SAM protein with 4Fe4S-binding SPASM domain
VTDRAVPLLFRADREVVARTIPHDVIFEVTQACNLDCRMCYVVGHREAHRDELNTEEAKGILDQLAEAGTLRLTFSGGEPFMRSDFLDLVEHARRRAFSIEVFTNGTLIGPESARRLRELAVWQVSVSILGASAATHDGITGRNGSFARAVHAIRTLREHGVKTRIKTLLMQANFPEYRSVVDLASELGVPYSLDPTVSSRNDGNTDTLLLALSDDQFRELVADPTLGPGSLSFDNVQLHDAREGRLGGYLCRAGISFCSISWNGDVLPCMQYPQPAGNLRRETFAAIWSAAPLLLELRNARRSSAPECRECELLPLCFRCPATAAIEKGNHLAAYDTACRRARLMDEVRRSRAAAAGREPGPTAS